MRIPMTDLQATPHIPVLLEEVIHLFSNHSLHRFVDGTVGAGGHAHALLSAHPEIEEYWAVDQDVDALAIARERLAPFASKVRFIHANFSETALLPTDCDGILLDIGLSSMQVDLAERGFSFMREGPLDMRMDRERGTTTAADIVNYWNVKDLATLFIELGEERKGRKIAEAICEKRRRTPFETTKELADLIEQLLGRHGPTHPATKIFQALRIEVNAELRVLVDALPALAEKLSLGGIMGVISFHSGEDRIVKQAFQKLVYTHAFSHIIKKPLIASRQECRKNPRSRSAKLRALSRLAPEDVFE